jgi:DNA-binding transcriptional LysR family regulator
MDRVHAMTTFVAVVDQGGFTQAARRLKVSPSAVTRSIAALEEHLGARLLQRTTRSVTLTDVGARYLARARQILADVQEAEASAQAERSTPTGRFVVAAPLVFGRLHVAPVVCAYLSRHPEVSCELTLGDRNINLVEDGVDAAVRIGRQDDTTLVSRVIGATRRVLVASPSYLAARGAPESVAALADHDTILFNPGSGAAEWRLTEHGRGPTDRRHPAVHHQQRGRRHRPRVPRRRHHPGARLPGGGRGARRPARRGAAPM